METIKRSIKKQISSDQIAAKKSVLIGQPPFSSPGLIGTIVTCDLHPFVGPSAERKSSLVPRNSCGVGV